MILISGDRLHRHVLLPNWIDRGCYCCEHWTRYNHHVIHCQMNCCFDRWNFGLTYRGCQHYLIDFQKSRYDCCNFRYCCHFCYRNFHYCDSRQYRCDSHCSCFRLVC
jgi:hypothetical protein